MQPKGLQTAIDNVAKEYERIADLPHANAINPYDGNVSAARGRERLLHALALMTEAQMVVAMLPLPVVEPKTAKPRKKATKKTTAKKT